MSQNAADEGKWPPRSPLDALKSTPGGRDRLRRLAERTSPSPSPIKRSNSTPSFRNQAALKPSAMLGDLNEDDEDEDEETLQLRLQEIQARLKLKKLQKAKGIEVGAVENVMDSARPGTAPLVRANSAVSRVGSDLAGLREQRLERSKSQASIHVPVSPTRKVQPIELPKSPGRVLLGIDKGLKASDVSLRRVPAQPGLRRAPDEAMRDTQRAGGYLQRTTSQLASHSSITTNRLQYAPEPKPMTFSERMANVRTEDADRREKDARIQRARSKAFDIGEQEMKNLKSTAQVMPDKRPEEAEFTRDQILSSFGNKEPGLQRSKSTPYLSSAARSTPETSERASNTSRAHPSSQAETTPSTTATRKRATANKDTSAFEPFSSLHLSKRIIPHTVLTRTLAGKKTMVLTDLLREVKAPGWRLPDVEEDIVLLAAIASKSEPKSHKSNGSNDDRGKYMVMALSDLKWEIDLFLFNSGFDKFWKLNPGTIIAILNPNIMPPMRADTGRFSLTVNSSDDTVLEIGTARDLGFCKTVKKDGKSCDAWVDKRHTEYCEFHVNETLKKTKAGRMEVNTMNNGGPKSGRGQGSWFRSHEVRRMEEVQEALRKKRAGIKYDRESQSTIYVSGTRGGNNAALLDSLDYGADGFHRESKEDRMRRQLAATEREASIAEKLSQTGGGLGAEYLQSQYKFQPLTANPSQNDPEPLPNAMALGLLGGKAKEIHLSPIKRKRAGTSNTSSLSGASAIGWGGNLTKELGRMKDGERLQPLKKKTRFVTDRGIKIAGRESFGGDVPKSADDNDDDDDDDLDIVK